MFILFIIHAPSVAQSQIPLNNQNTIRFIGDIRTGYFGFIGEQRNGDRLSQHELRNRARIGLEFQLTEKLVLHTRYAARISSLDFHFDPGINTTAQGNDGLLMGEGAFDVFFASVQFTGRLSAKAGRFQTSFTLDGIIKNSILRQDSPNTDIGWTDGIHISAKPSAGWTTDVIAQGHFKNAPTNVFRYPLSPSASDIPFTLFMNIKKDLNTGPLSSLALNITYSPDALIMSPEGRRGGYLAASIMPQFQKQFTSGRRLLFGSEIAYSFIRTERSVIGFTESPGANSGGFGFQSIVNVMEVFKNQHIAAMVTILQPALLSSSAFWNNLLLFELRHSVRFSRKLTTDLRLRYRADLDTLNPEFNRRWQLYPFARMSYRF